MELKVIETNRYKRRNSQQKEKIIIKTCDDETVKIIPSVLMTYNEKFINIREITVDKKIESNVLSFKRSDSLRSSEA